MKLYVQNFTGQRLPIPGVGTLQARTSRHLFIDIDSGDDFSTYEHGINAAAALKSLKASGKIDFEYVLEDSDQGKTGLAHLTVDFARGDLAVADVTATFTSPLVLPAGAILLNAYLDVHTLFAGGAVSAVAADCGVDGIGDAFGAATDVLAAPGRFAQTDLAATSDLGGMVLSLTLNSTDGDLADLVQGKATLYVTYQVANAV